MKKRKISFLLNICTICLAVVAIVIGVYSLQQAKLTVNGSLGFVAHNVNARVDAYMYGYSVSTNGAPITAEQKVRLTPQNGLLIHDQKTNYSLNLGATDGTGSQTRYFSNLGTSGKMEDIVVEITISNTSVGTTSPFNILANVDFANCVSPVAALKDKIVVDCDKSGAVLETTSGKTQTTFTFKISLKQNTDGTYGDTALTSPSANNVQLQMNLEQTTTYTQSQLKGIAVIIKEFTTEEKKSIKTGLGSLTAGPKTYEYTDTILCYAERFPYYVEMGEYNSTKLRWLIVGTSASDGTITTLSDDDRTAFSKGLMLNKTYVMLSEKILLTDTDQSMPFQNQYTNSEEYLNDYGYSAQDYATSNIRQYLIGNTVKNGVTSSNGKYAASGTDVNIMTKYNLNNDSMYEEIQARSLTSLYNESAISGSTKDMLIVPTSKENYTAVNDTPDKLWLLSQTEMTKIFNADYVSGNGQGPNVYMSSRTGVINTSYSTYWWLRSPYSSNVYSVRSVNGQLGAPNASSNTQGVRPAFLF